MNMPVDIPIDYKIIVSFLIAFVVVFVSIPSIIKVSHTKHLFDKPEERKSHTHETPTLGGLAIFAGIVMAISICCDSCFRDFKFIIGAMIIVFFIGLKDDILIIAPLTKMMGQIVAALILIFLGQFTISHLHGFYGVTKMSIFPSILLSLFVIIVIINGFNLIDGIDGLCSGIGVLTSSVYGVWFYVTGQFQYSIICAAIVGSLLAFIRYNVFSVENKIFMGDTGSLILGLLLAILTIHFNELNINASRKFAIHSAPAVSFGILILPMFDVLRVMFIRLVIKQSPFQADRNHLHHILLDLGFSHRKSTIILLLVNSFFITFVFYFQHLEILRLILMLILMAMIFAFVLTRMLEQKRKEEKKKHHADRHTHT